MDSLTPNHRRYALITIALAITLDFILGYAFGIADHIGVWRGLYFATVTATTVGYGDIAVVGWLPHVLAIFMMVTVIPLFGATFSLFTSGLTSFHVHRAKEELKQHVNDTLGNGPTSGS